MKGFSSSKLLAVFQSNPQYPLVAQNLGSSLLFLWVLPFFMRYLYPKATSINPTFKRSNCISISQQTGFNFIYDLIDYRCPVDAGHDVSGSVVLVEPGMAYVVTLTCQSHPDITESSPT